MKKKCTLALALALSLAACGNQTGSDESTPPAVNSPDTPPPAPPLLRSRPKMSKHRIPFPLRWTERQTAS